ELSPPYVWPLPTTSISASTTGSPGAAVLLIFQPASQSLTLLSTMTAAKASQASSSSATRLTQTIGERRMAMLIRRSVFSRGQLTTASSTFFWLAKPQLSASTVSSSATHSNTKRSCEKTTTRGSPCALDRLPNRT